MEMELEIKYQISWEKCKSKGLTWICTMSVTPMQDINNKATHRECKILKALWHKVL